MNLPPMDVSGRAGRLRERLADADCEALLVTSLTDVRYLTGFTGSAALLLVGPDELVFVTDGRYRDQAGEELGAAGVAARLEVHPSAEGQREALAGASKGISRLGLQAASVSWAAARRYGDSWFPDAELVPTEGLVEGLREVKDTGEVARIAAACTIADGALAEVRPLLADRPTERHPEARR